MNKVRITTGKVGLVFRKGNFVKVITEGTYWIWPFQIVKIFDMSQPFEFPIELNILLRNKDLADLLTIVEIKDNEIVLKYENGNFKKVLTPGRYAYWNGYTEFKFVKVNLDEIEIDNNIEKSVLQNGAIAQYIRVFVVESYEKGILFIDGKYNKIIDTGIYYFWKNTTAVSVIKADMRQLQMEVSGQEILTKDKAALRINFNTQYKVIDIEKALIDNKDFEKQLYVLMQLALRAFIGTLTLDELLDNKQVIAEYVFKAMKSDAVNLGVKILNCGVKDIILPGDVKDIMNEVLIAQKKAQANIITRREETASTRNLLNTARLMEENSMLFKLKEMEYVEKIADKINNISLSGGNQVVDQLKAIFSPDK